MERAMRSAILRRLSRLESAIAVRQPLEPAIVWRCRGGHVSAADRRAAAEHAGRIGKPGARVIYTLVTDSRRKDRIEPEEVATEAPTEHPMLARLRALQPERRGDAISEQVTLGRITPAEAEEIRAMLRESAA
jgi:hypothetical protein